jgi:hypothetical protein
MTFREFNKLHKDQQLDYLWQQGFVIRERKNGRYSYILYRLDSFFVELRYFHSMLHGFKLYSGKKELEV